MRALILAGQGVLWDGRPCDGPRRDPAGSQRSVPLPCFLWRGSGATLQDAQTQSGHAGAHLQWYCANLVLFLSLWILKQIYCLQQKKASMRRCWFISDYVILPTDLNAQYYLMIRRQMMFELAEIYNEMMDLKLTLANRQADSETLDNHTIKKFNHLCSASAKWVRVDGPCISVQLRSIVFWSPVFSFLDTSRCS